MKESGQSASRTPRGFQRQIGVLGSVAPVLSCSVVFDSFSLHGACQAPLSMGFSRQIEPLATPTPTRVCRQCGQSERSEEAQAWLCPGSSSVGDAKCEIQVPPSAPLPEAFLLFSDCGTHSAALAALVGIWS